MRQSQILSLNERIANLRSRPLAVTNSGDPEKKSETIVTAVLHTCHNPGAFKPDFCDCVEVVELTHAYKLIQEGRAEWVRSLRKNGEIYVWRQEIVLNQQETLPTSDLVQMVDGQTELQNSHAAHLEEKRLEKNRKKRARSIRDLLLTVRSELTPEENARIFDDRVILEAARTDDHAQVITLIFGSEKLSPDNEFAALERIAAEGRIRAALLHATYHYWDIELAAHGLTAEHGKFLTRAPKGRGLVVSGGYGAAKIEKVGAHSEKNENGTHRTPVTSEDENDYEANQQVPDDYKIKGKLAGERPELDIRPYERPAERDAIAPDAFEIEQEKEEKC